MKGICLVKQRVLRISGTMKGNGEELPLASCRSVGGTRSCGRLGKSDAVCIVFEGGNYNLWVPGMWSDNISP
jgi:hypothetical protein